ncbi:MAG: prolipoprotein diacylglyceryl transferase family protein [Desulfotignum sp.]
MMHQMMFIGTIALLVIVLLWWGCSTLPKERWQIMAVVPRQKDAHGRWNGLNLTYYGLLSANAYTFAVIVFFILSASTDVPAAGLIILITGLLGVCLPASAIVARIVEKKQATLTVGGAVFIGTLVFPWMVVLVNHTLGPWLGYPISPMGVMAAAAIAYAFGEGLGRLACISFGCCYGRPLHLCHPMVQPFLSRFCLTFTGHTKKIAYASGLDGQKVLPVQIMTATLYCFSGLTGIVLFLIGHPVAALLLTLIITQVWRIFSEFLRADFRGGARITPYQVMALATLAYAAVLTILFPAPDPAFLPRLDQGLSAVWTPWMILFFQCVWVISFLHTGRSRVTGANIRFHVEEKQI